jgi:hypothetical protein
MIQTKEGPLYLAGVATTTQGEVLVVGEGKINLGAVDPALPTPFEPFFKLEVAQMSDDPGEHKDYQARFFQTDIAQAYLQIGADGSLGNIQAGSYDDTSETFTARDLILQKDGGNVLIADTTQPSPARLLVNGRVAANDFCDLNGQNCGLSGNQLWEFAPNTGSLWFKAGVDFESHLFSCDKNTPLNCTDHGSKWHFYDIVEFENRLWMKPGALIACDYSGACEDMTIPFGEDGMNLVTYNNKIWTARRIFNAAEAGVYSIDKQGNWNRQDVNIDFGVPDVNCLATNPILQVFNDELWVTWNCNKDGEYWNVLVVCDSTENCEFKRFLYNGAQARYIKSMGVFENKIWLSYRDTINQEYPLRYCDDVYTCSGFSMDMGVVIEDFEVFDSKFWIGISCEGGCPGVIRSSEIMSCDANCDNISNWILRDNGIGGVGDLLSDSNKLWVASENTGNDKLWSCDGQGNCQEEYDFSAHPLFTGLNPADHMVILASTTKDRIFTRPTDVRVGINTQFPDSSEQDLMLDVEGAMGAEWYCDSDGNNCIPGDKINVDLPNCTQGEYVIYNLSRGWECYGCSSTPCYTVPDCTCSDWTEYNCGDQSCNTMQMYRARTCAPPRCDIERECIPHPTCGNQGIWVAVDVFDQANPPTMQVTNIGLLPTNSPGGDVFRSSSGYCETIRYNPGPGFQYECDIALANTLNAVYAIGSVPPDGAWIAIDPFTQDPGPAKQIMELELIPVDDPSGDTYRSSSGNCNTLRYNPGPGFQWECDIAVANTLNAVYAVGIIPAAGSWVGIDAFDPENPVDQVQGSLLVTPSPGGDLYRSDSGDCNNIVWSGSKWECDIAVANTLNSVYTIPR